MTESRKHSLKKHDQPHEREENDPKQKKNIRDKTYTGYIRRTGRFLSPANKIRLFKVTQE